MVSLDKGRRGFAGQKCQHGFDHGFVKAFENIKKHFLRAFFGEDVPEQRLYHIEPRHMFAERRGW